MKTVSLFDCFLVWPDGEKLKILNASLIAKTGGLIVEGWLDSHDVTSNLVLESKLRFDRREGRLLVADLPKIEATRTDGSAVTVLGVDCNRCLYPSLEVSFYCYTHSVEVIGSRAEAGEVDRLMAFSVEGLRMQYRSATRLTQTRRVFDKDRTRLISSSFDFREVLLPLHPSLVNKQLRIAFLEDAPNGAVIVQFDQGSQPSLATYASLRSQLQSFLSFAAECDLVIRSEEYWESGEYLRKTYSSKMLKSKIRSGYIPIAHDEFRSHHIVEDYLRCFPTYLHLDKELGLSEVIFLINQAKKGVLESRVFILCIAIEKLAKHFQKSKLYKGALRRFIDEQHFTETMEPVAQAFDASFKSLKGLEPKTFNDLRSKLMNINSKGYTDLKVDALLNYAEVDRTGAEHLFPKTRNHAIHEGNIDVPTGAARDNYIRLDRLVNECIANLIQYKGIRLIETTARGIVVDTRTSFTPSYVIS